MEANFTWRSSTEHLGERQNGVGLVVHTCYLRIPARQEDRLEIEARLGYRGNLNPVLGTAWFVV